MGWRRVNDLFVRNMVHMYWRAKGEGERRVNGLV